LSCLAQQQALPVVGFLNSALADGCAGMAEAFRQGLKETGYVEGQNVTIEYRWTNNAYEELPAKAANLVERQLTVIVAKSPSIAPAEAAIKTIAIAF
jgi:putative tryptophan/tyrosine transport system substrate-binding protein